MLNRPMKLLIGFALGVLLLKCADDPTKYVTPACSETATVVDYSSLDGCGLLLQLSNGKLLMPLRLTYVQAPTRAEDPMYYYQLQAGEKLLIGYREVEQGINACMAGEFVAFITCIRPVEEK
jgi:hypothetical protein